MNVLVGVKSIWKKTEAAVIVQNLLEHQFNCGILELSPPDLATKLVQEAWNGLPDVMNGKFGRRPHKFTVAAVALWRGIEAFGDDELNQGALLIALGNLLQEVDVNGALYDFGPIDNHMLEKIALSYVRLGEQRVD